MTKKTKIKTVIKKVYVKPAEDDQKIRTEVKGELKTLEEQREKAPTGIKGIFRRAALNKAINQRTHYLNAERNIAMMKSQVKLTSAQIELEQNREKLRGFQEKKRVDFNSILPEKPKKQLSIEDLY